VPSQAVTVKEIADAKKKVLVKKYFMIKLI